MEVVTAGIGDDLLAVVLADLATRLDTCGIAWALGGSASRRVRGAARAPRDVDVLVDVDVADDLVAALGDLDGPGHARPTDWRSAWLLVWRHPSGAIVEFIGGGAVVVDGVVVDLLPSSAVEVAWNGLDVPVSDPATWDRLARPDGARDVGPPP